MSSLFWTNFEAREKLRKGEKRNACKRAEGCMPSHVGVWRDKDLPCDLCRHSRTCCPFYTSRPLPGDGDSTRPLCGHGAVEPTQRSPSDNTLEDGVILMGQKKGVDLFVIGGNLFHEWQQLAHQGQHQARFGASEDHIGLQLRVVQQFHNRSRSIGWVGMPRVLELLLNLLERSCSCYFKGWIGLQEPQRTLLLQFREQIEGHGIIGFEASGELIDQTRLRADQAILVTCQLFELGYLVTIRGQSMQICEISAPGLGQQVGIDRIGLGTTGRSPTIHSARINWVHRPAGLQQVNNQQTMSGFNNTRHLFFGRRTNDLHQKGVQLGKSLWGMIHTDRTHLMPFFVNRQGIMVLIRPVNTGIPHQKRSSLHECFLNSRALILWRSKRDSLMIGLAQEQCQGSASFLNRSSRVDETDFPWLVQQFHRTSVLLFQPCVEWAC